MSSHLHFGVLRVDPHVYAFYVSEIPGNQSNLLVAGIAKLVCEVFCLSEFFRHGAYFEVKNFVNRTVFLLKFQSILNKIGYLLFCLIIILNISPIIVDDLKALNIKRNGCSLPA